LTDPLAKLEELYRTTGSVRTSGLNRESSWPLYSRYVEFVCAFAEGRVLDIGCGSGWSTYWLAEKGFDATGLDLQSAAFEPARGGRLRFVEGSATKLPFMNGMFDVVAAHQCLEHVLVPSAALREMIRVARPGGVVCIVGPNLLSFAPTFHALTRYVWQSRPKRRILFRDADTPSHPFGNTLPECMWYLGRNLLLTSWKRFNRRATFTMREPDTRPPFHSDNDSVYLCNPLDLTRFFRAKRCTILRDTALGRSGLTRMLAGGTWVAARTPSH
jgi:SAM-dependent methyltransferase